MHLYPDTRQAPLLTVRVVQREDRTKIFADDDCEQVAMLLLPALGQGLQDVRCILVEYKDRSSRMRLSFHAVGLVERAVQCVCQC